MAILKNRIQCKKCLDIIESTHVHDFVWCKCRSVSVDGGREYLKRSGRPEDIHDLSSGKDEKGKPWPAPRKPLTSEDILPPVAQLHKGSFRTTEWTAEDEAKKKEAPFPMSLPSALRQAVQVSRLDLTNAELYRLCYVEDNFAYFTSRPLTGEGRQWGDDWAKAPYERNAGAPYIEVEGDMKIVAYMGGGLVTPRYGHTDSPYSVEDINAGAHPWLSSREHRVYVYAGCTPEHFKAEVEKAGGRVFL